MKCQTCRKSELELTTRWDRLKAWTLRKLFSVEAADLSQEKFTQGFGDGYKEGFDRAKELEVLQRALDQSMKDHFNGRIDNVISYIDSLHAKTPKSKNTKRRFKKSV